MDAQLISSCLSIYLKLRLIQSVEKLATSMYRTVATIVLRASPTQTDSFYLGMINLS